MGEGDKIMKQLLAFVMHTFILSLSSLQTSSSFSPTTYFYALPGNLPLTNSIHLDETSSAVILSPNLNMTFCRETYEVDFLHEDLRILSKTYADSVRRIKKKKVN